MSRSVQLLSPVRRIVWYPGCDDGSTPVQCLKNPCQVSSCPSVADARCVVDYCGGCNARWILNGQEVTDQCHGKVAIIYTKPCSKGLIFIFLLYKNPQVVLMAPSLSIVWLIHVRWIAVHCSQQPLVRLTTVEGAMQSSTWMMWKLHMHVVSQSFRLNMLPCLKSLFAGSGKFQWIFQRFNLSWTISNFSWYCIARYYCKLTITAELPFGSL